MPRPRRWPPPVFKALIDQEVQARTLVVDGPYMRLPGHSLKLGARVGIVDAFAPTSEHGTPPSVLRCELAAVGYREISFDRLDVSNAYLAIFAPPSAASRVRPEAIVACKSP